MRVFLLVGFAALMMFYSSLVSGNTGCNQIFVANLNDGTVEETLRGVFEWYGTVTEAKIIIDRDTRRSRGFGFVTMPNCQEAAAAIADLNQSELDGRTIVVKLANGSTNQRPGSPDGGRGGYGNGRGGGGGYRRDGDGN